MTGRLAPVAVAVLLLLSGCAAPEPEPVVEVGAPLPEFELPARDGSTIAAESLAGSPAVVAFFASWCRPCIGDIPELNRLAAEDHVPVVAIALDEDGWRTVDPFVEKHGFEATIALGNEEVFRRFGGFTIPYTLVVDEARIVRAIYRGPVTRDEVLALIEPLQDTTRPVKGS